MHCSPRLVYAFWSLILGLLVGPSVVHAQVVSSPDAANDAPAMIGVVWTATADVSDQIARWQRPGAPLPATSEGAANLPDALSDFESEVIDLVNAERAEEGCPALTAHPTLRQVAYAHSQDMAVRDFFSHVNPDGEELDDRVNETDYDWMGLAENIAAGYETPERVVEGWMNSPGHRANILNCTYLDIGVGYYYAANSTYEHYWTQVFGRPRNTTPGPDPDPDPDPDPNPDPDPDPDLMTKAAFLPLTVKPAPVRQPTPNGVVVNGDFEQGPGVGWVEDSSVLGTDTGIIITQSPNTTTLPPHSGVYLAWLGGVYDEVSSISQEITLPAGTLTLEYAYWVFSQEAGCGYDMGVIALRRGNQEEVLTVLPMCDAAESPDWVVEQIDLSPYAGATWTLVFEVTTDSSLNSNFFLDDIQVIAGR